MKKILVIMLLFIAFAKESKAQTYGVPDTLAYLQNIVASKAQYIGQPFTVLLNDLQIQVKFFSHLRVLLKISIRKLQRLLHFISHKQQKISI